LYTEDSEYNEMRAGGYGNFLTAAQQARLERLRQATMLYKGQHRQYFLDEGRTQADFPPMRVGDRMIQPYITYNALRLVSFKSSDLLLGAEARIKVSIPAQQDSLKRLIEFSCCHQLFYSSSRDGSYQGEQYIEAILFNGRTALRTVPTEEIFPIGVMSPDMQFPRYDRYSVQNVGTDKQPIILLLVTSYLPGRIARKLYQLADTSEGKPVKTEINLDQWQLPEGEAPLMPLVNTGIVENTITWIPNELDGGCPVSDYDIAIPKQDTLNAKETQLFRAIAKHADPKMAFPQLNANGQGNADNKDAFFFRTKDDIPQYLQWNAELESAIKERDNALHGLLIATETSPVLLGMRDGSGNAAYKKVKVEAMNSLKKAERKSVYWTIGIRRALSTAQSLEQTIPGVRYDREPIGVSLQDGIPLDDLDEANRLAVLRGVGLISLRRGIEAQLDDPAAVAAELEELAEENAAKAPNVFMGTQMPGSPAGDQSIEAGEETAATQAAQAEEAMA
jgi:hypothetical protein